MQTNNKKGCQLCDATWGEYYRDIDDQKMLFCCSICADIFEEMVKRIHKNTGWKTIETITLIGNYSSGRHCTATSGNEEFRYYFRTDGSGRFLEFRIEEK